MAVMGDIEEHEERKIITEFVHLLDKSKQLFNGLRDLPQYGHKQWQVCLYHRILLNYETLVPNVQLTESASYKNGHYSFDVISFRVKN